MTRIIAGVARGRRLHVPKGGTRPTSDRAREGVFSALDDLLGLAGRTVVDLYAGTGALGLEALSRGAVRVDLVESVPSALTVLRENVKAVGLPGAHVHAMTVARWVRKNAADATGEERKSGPPPAEILLLDPPYARGQEEVQAVLLAMAAASAVAPGCVVAVERSARGGQFDWPTGFTADRDRRYGEATVWFGRFGSVAAC